MTAREEVLARIAVAHRAAPPPDLPYEAVTRGYRTTSELSGPELLDRLVERLVDYRAQVRRCGPDEIAATVVAALAERGVQVIIRPDGLDPGWLAEVSCQVKTDSLAAPLSVPELDGCDGVVTACATAVAETGTLVLDGSADQGRRVISLIPDYHLCVVRAEQVRPDVPQALAGLEPTRPITMIAGPSATSDIELNRVEGVHGPRTLEVIVVG